MVTFVTMFIERYNVHWCLGSHECTMSVSTCEHFLSCLNLTVNIFTVIYGLRLKKYLSIENMLHSVTTRWRTMIQRVRDLFLK